MVYAIYCVDHCPFSNMLTTRVDNERFMVSMAYTSLFAVDELNRTEL